jgi:hypothetical protein
MEEDLQAVLQRVASSFSPFMFDRLDLDLVLFFEADEVFH